MTLTAEYTGFELTIQECVLSACESCKYEQTCLKKQKERHTDNGWCGGYELKMMKKEADYEYYYPETVTTGNIHTVRT